MHEEKMTTAVYHFICGGIFIAYRIQLENNKYIKQTEIQLHKVIKMICTRL